MPLPADRRISRADASTARRASRLAALIAAVLFVAPTTVFAGRVELAWDPSPDPSVTGYVIYYGTAKGVHNQSVDVGNRTSYAIDNVNEGTTYYLVVRAYNAARVFSSPSNEVRRVGVFTDDPLTPGVHMMRLAHITELRARIDVLRAIQKLPVMSWTPVGGATMIRTGAITELRTAINAVYTALKKTLPVYTDPVLSPGVTMLKAAHIRELRTAVVAVE